MKLLVKKKINITKLYLQKCKNVFESRGFSVNLMPSENIVGSATVPTRR